MSAVGLADNIARHFPKARERDAKVTLTNEDHADAPTAMRFNLRSLIALLTLLAASSFANADELRAVRDLANPESAIVGTDGRVYVSEIGEFNKDGDGKITVIGTSGAPKLFAKGLDDPKGLAARKDWLFVTDKTRIWKIDGQGHASVFVKASDFPQPPLFLNDLAFDSRGNLYVSDTGDIENGGKGASSRSRRTARCRWSSPKCRIPPSRVPTGCFSNRRANCWRLTSQAANYYG